MVRILGSYLGKARNENIFGATYFTRPMFCGIHSRGHAMRLGAMCFCFVFLIHGQNMRGKTMVK